MRKKTIALPEGVRQFVADNKKELYRTAVVFVLILATGLYFKCKIWQMIPLFVSLTVILLQLKANRYMFLVGACNAGIGYTLVYFSQGLYAMAAYSLLCSCPMQILTFILWNRKAYKHSTMLKRLSKKQIILIVSGFAAAWLAMYLIFSLVGSPYLVFDNTTTLVGILSTILSMCSYLEYSLLGVLTYASSTLTYLFVIMDQPDQMPHLIYSLYAMISTAMSFFYMRKLYREQRKEAE